MENGREEIIGYGDPECTKGCPARVASTLTCMLMVFSTEFKIAAARAGNMGEAAKHERKQNLYAVDLGCEPGRNRM